MVRNAITIMDNAKEEIIRDDGKHKYAKLFGLGVAEGILNGAVILGGVAMISSAISCLGYMFKR